MSDRAQFDVRVAPTSRAIRGSRFEGRAGLRDHHVRERPLGHAEMTRMETVVLAVGWSTALAAVFIRFIGIG